MGQCIQCNYFIPEGATKCGHCQTYQAKGFMGCFLNNISSLGVLISILGVSVTLAMTCFIGCQTNAIKKQTEIATRQVALENRPYLYVVPVPLATLQPLEQRNLLAGVIVYYGNYGNYSANEIEVIDYALYSDKGNQSPYPVKEYWETTYGGIQKIDSIPPKEKIPALDCRAGMGGLNDNERRYIQFSIRMKYKGIGEDKHAYGLDYIYIVDGVENGVPKPVMLFSKQYSNEDNEKLPEIKYLIGDYLNNKNKK